MLMETTRLNQLMALMDGDGPHEPAASSTLDVLAVLYERVLRREGPDEDHFLLSKGHGPQAYFAVLAASGCFPADWLAGFGSFASPLGHHPDRKLVPGVELSSGSLGHGLAIAVGLAVGLEATGRGGRVFCLVGDGELDEGSNYEAIVLAGRRRLGNLRVVAVDNRSSSLGWPGGLERRFSLEGWSARRVDGHDREDLESALTAPTAGSPAVVVANVGLAR